MQIDQYIPIRMDKYKIGKAACLVGFNCKKRNE